MPKPTPQPPDVMKVREQLQRRWQALQSERSSWISHWQEISAKLLPRSGRFMVQDRNRGDRRHNEILDNTATRACQTLAAGMLTGSCSPAQDWFELEALDPDLNRYHPVKVWLEEVTRRMQRRFRSTNTYRVFKGMFREMAVFGTAPALLLADDETLLHLYPIPVGQYAVASDFKDRINTLFREFEMTVAQVVAQFGLENCSHTVRNLYQDGNLEAGVPVVHAIEPREDRDSTQADARNMPWLSCYWEPGGDEGRVLRWSGFERFRALAPRWDVIGGDVYGSPSPGMEALGDIKQLQHEQFRKGQGINQQSLPAVILPTSMKGEEANLVPGGVLFSDSPTPGVPVYDGRYLRLDHLLLDIQDVRIRIERSFFTDLFRMIVDADKRMTYGEVAARQEEKLALLGPVMEHVNTEMLGPHIEMSFDLMLQRGEVPPIPEELSGQVLNVRFVSMLARAQRSAGISSIDRFTMATLALAAHKPEVLDRLDPDSWVEDYADRVGVSPKIVVPRERAQELRQARNAAMAAREQSEMLAQQAGAVRDLANAPTGDGNSNALSSLAGAQPSR